LLLFFYHLVGQSNQDNPVTLISNPVVNSENVPLNDKRIKALDRLIKENEEKYIVFRDINVQSWLFTRNHENTQDLDAALYFLLSNKDNLVTKMNFDDETANFIRDRLRKKNSVSLGALLSWLFLGSRQSSSSQSQKVTGKQTTNITHSPHLEIPQNANQSTIMTMPLLQGEEIKTNLFN